MVILSAEDRFSTQRFVRDVSSGLTCTDNDLGTAKETAGLASYSNSACDKVRTRERERASFHKNRALFDGDC